MNFTLRILQCIYDLIVVVNGESSSPSLVTSRVPQGTVLAPFYFYAILMTLQQTYLQKSNYMLMMY